MQPSRTLDQILGELSSTYDPQVNSIRTRQAEIPGQVAAEEQGLQAKQTSAYDEILGGARRRGLGFSGIPLGEQAKYSATEYMPALARLRQSGREQAMGLEDAILGLNTQRRTQAQGIYDNERNFGEQQRQFNEQMKFNQQQAAAQQRAAASKSANSFNPSYGGQPTQAPAPQASISRKQSGGFAFADQGGNAISAAKYAALNKTDVRDVLYQMGQAGDSYSQQLYNQLAQDTMFGRGNGDYDKKIMKAYSPIFWGTF